MTRFKDTRTQQYVWGDTKAEHANMLDYVMVNEDGDDVVYYVQRKHLVRAPLTITDDLMQF